VPGGLETVAELLRERIDLEGGHDVCTLPSALIPFAAGRCCRARSTGGGGN
jgi:hypothetical protein